MKVQSVASPHAVQATNVNHQAQADAKARAIAKLTPAPQQHSQPLHPVQNPSNIAPEEMSAILAPSNENTEVEDTQEVQAPVKDPNQLKQNALLARRERALRDQARKQQQDFQAREAALQAREAQLTAKDQQYKDGYISRQSLKDQTLQALAEAGVSYDDVVAQVLNQQPVDPRMQAHINKLEAKLAQIEANAEESKQSAIQQQDAQYKAAVKQIEMDARLLVTKDPSYEAIRKTRSVKDVVDLITKTFDEEGRVMSVQEAADEVENYLVEQISQYSRIDKIRKQLNLGTSNPKQAAPAKQPGQTQQTQPMKTLTNSTTGTRQLSARERALLAFKGQL